MPTFNDIWSIYKQYYAPSRLFPHHTHIQKSSQIITSLLDIKDQFDVLLLDGFGVLNVGTEAISGMPQMINQLIHEGKSAFVLTNGASYPSFRNAERYPALGYHIPQTQVISSRDALEQAIKEHPLTLADKCWGVIATETYDPTTIPARTVLLTQQNITQVDGFIFLGTLTWQMEDHLQLIEALKAEPRPLLIGNPDVCAPLPDRFTIEPGYYCAELSTLPGSALSYFGKPFQACYEFSYDRIQTVVGSIERSRILMVGDTLHTDILGGNTFGTKTALMADWGFLRGKNPMPYIEEAQITPDFILTRHSFPC